MGRITELGLAALLAGVIVTYSASLLHGEDKPDFCAAYLPLGRDGTAATAILSLFPATGVEARIALAADLPENLRVLAFSRDGRRILAQIANPLSREGIREIGLRPATDRIIPGSQGLGEVWHVTESNSSKKLFVSGWSKRTGRGECGAFEIDPVTAGFLELRKGSYPDCGGANGSVSPDGQRFLGYSGTRMTVADLKSGSVRVVDGKASHGAWSPNGRWLAAARQGKVVLYDTETLRLQRSLGPAGNGELVWSPDSNYILLARPKTLCWLYFQSLEVLNVNSGKRAALKSSNCRVLVGGFGWVSPEEITAGGAWAR
jgi:WD40 repeat protein